MSPAAFINSMNFHQSLDVANKKEQLVGHLKKNGAVLDEVIIAPTDDEKYQGFIKAYVDTLDAQRAIAPYIKSDVIVLGVFDKYRIRRDNLLSISEI